MGSSKTSHSDAGCLVKSSSSIIVPNGMAVEDASQGILPSLSVGTMINGHFRIEKLLDASSMSTVYLVTDTNQQGNFLYALKTNKNSGADTLQAPSLLGILSHKKPHIVRTVGMGHDNALKLDYIVMEYIEGMSLAKIMERVGYLTEIECLVVGYEVSQALEALEVCRVLHCDVKPANIMLDLNGTVLLTDFGISISLTKDASMSRRMAATLKKPKGGTPLYESPEQWRRLPTIDIRSDFFSLGATLYHLATARHAYPGTTMNEVFAFRARHHSPAMTPKHANPLLSRAFSRFILDMMAYNPEERPRTSVYLKEGFLELGCPEDEEERQDIMKNLLVRKSAGDLPKPRQDYPEVIVNILKNVGFVLFVIIVIWLCHKYI